MATLSNHPEKQMPATVSGEPTDLLAPEEDNFEEETPDTDDDLNSNEESYEGIRNGEEEGLVDDNMTGMPVVPSPS